MIVKWMVHVDVGGSKNWKKERTRREDGRKKEHGQRMEERIDEVV